MSQRYTSKSILVKCPICGQLCHSRGLHMHMKLAHGQGFKDNRKVLAENSGGVTRINNHKAITDREKDQLFVLLGAMAAYLGYRLLKKK